MLVLAAGTGKEGPGPLVSNLGQDVGTISDPDRHRSGAIERRGTRRAVLNRRYRPACRLTLRGGKPHL